MTLEEAKKILEKEGFKLGGPGNVKPGVVSEAFAEYESPEICEAMQIVCSAVLILAHAITLGLLPLQPLLGSSG